MIPGWAGERRRALLRRPIGHICAAGGGPGVSRSAFRCFRCWGCICSGIVLCCYHGVQPWNALAEWEAPLQLMQLMGLSQSGSCWTGEICTAGLTTMSCGMLSASSSLPTM